MANPFDQFDGSDNPFDQFDAAPQPKPFSPAQMVRNVPGSALDFGKSIVQTIAHPINTLGNLATLGEGAVQNALPQSWQATSAQPARDVASSVGHFYKDRYGSAQGFKSALESDPVGILSDASMLFSGGTTAAAKLPKLAKAAELASKAADPIALALSKGTGLLGRGAASVVGNLGTHTGAEPILQAFKAGQEGGQRAETLLSNMRGNAPVADTLAEAKAALDKMRADRGATYRQGMAGVAADTTPLDVQPIIDAFNKQSEMGTFKGKVLNSSTVETQQKLRDLITDWTTSKPEDFHTPEGLDALKKAVGDVRDSTEFGSPSRKAADGVYNSIKAQIVKQAPDYAKVMKDYEVASDQMREIERALSLGDRASADTGIRKLQSVMRNNVNANYGSRLEMAKKLEENGATNLFPALAGQSLSAIAPRGLGKLGASVGATGLLSTIVGLPAAAGLLALQSPRLIGEASYYAGKATRGGRGLLDASGIKPGLAARIAYQMRERPTAAPGGLLATQLTPDDQQYLETLLSQR